MSMDLALSRAIMLVHILEKAVHDQGFWTMELSGVTVAAQRVIDGNRVIFSAEFPEMWIIDDASPLSLYCDGDLVLSREAGFISSSSGHPFMAEWVFSIPEEVAA